MREVLFRGKRQKNGEWVYGDLLQIPKHELYSIMHEKEDTGNFIVDKNTIGQYTGLCDKNGTKIFEGDIVKETFEGVRPFYGQYGLDGTEDFYGFKIGKVTFGGTGTFVIASRGELWVDGEKAEYKPTRRKRIAAYRCEVIGNIHDNPELLN